MVVADIFVTDATSKISVTLSGNGFIISMIAVGFIKDNFTILGHQHHAAWRSLVADRFRGNIVNFIQVI